jgi:hypothetical protein
MAATRAFRIDPRAAAVVFWRDARGKADDRFLLNDY